jgi:hypothetical protein
VSDEWRLTVRLDGAAHEIENVARGLSELASGRVTREGATLRVYSTSEAEAAETERVLLTMLEDTALGYELWQDRWDDEQRVWEELAPDAPSEP